MDTPNALAVTRLEGLVVICGLAAVILMVCALISLARSAPSQSRRNTVLWLILIMCLPVIGSVLWFAAKLRRRARQAMEPEPARL